MVVFFRGTPQRWIPQSALSGVRLLFDVDVCMHALGLRDCVPLLETGWAKAAALQNVLFRLEARQTVNLHQDQACKVVQERCTVKL